MMLIGWQVVSEIAAIEQQEHHGLNSYNAATVASHDIG